MIYFPSGQQNSMQILSFRYSCICLRQPVNMGLEPIAGIHQLLPYFSLSFTSLNRAERRCKVDCTFCIIVYLSPSRLGKIESSSSTFLVIRLLSLIMVMNGEKRLIEAFLYCAHGCPLTRCLRDMNFLHVQTWQKKIKFRLFTWFWRLVSVVVAIFHPSTKGLHQEGFFLLFTFS